MGCSIPYCHNKTDGKRKRCRACRDYHNSKDRARRNLRKTANLYAINGCSKRRTAGKYCTFHRNQRDTYETNRVLKLRREITLARALCDHAS